MTLAGTIRTVFPAPRRAVTPASAAPLVGFVLVFVGVCMLAEAADWVVFTWPAAFATLLLTPWLWWMHVAGYGGLTGWRSVVSLLVRLTLIGLFAILLAEPRAVRKSDALSVIFVLDQSQSIRPEARDRALEYLARLASEKPEADEVGLITFARDAAVELPPSVIFPFEGGLAVQVERDGTSLEKALSLGAAVLPEDHQGRLVLVSDGVPTEGNHVPVLDDLKSRGIAVNVLPITYDYEHEVLIERLELPRMVKTGETYEAAVIVWSAQAGHGELFLQENGQIIFRAPVEFQAGKNRYVVPIYLRDSGYYEYTVSIEVAPEADSWTRNNIGVSYLYLQGKGRVLVVTDPAGDPRDWEPMVKALREAERAVDLKAGFEFPSDSLALRPYDCIVFVNVGADQFVVTQMEALKEAVETHGTGFVMVGGENSYGPGGYHRTAVEEILPVTMDVTQRKVLPKSALAIVLHTCEFPAGNTWGKRITKQAIKVLGAQDEVGVLVYDFQGAEKWLFPLTPAGEYPRLAPLINNAQIGDMPDFQRTMKMALTGLKNSDAATKHVIIISDGDPQPPLPALLASFAAAKISVSTVAVFPHGGSVQTMQLIARSTGGRFYFPKDPKLLPSIFIKEAKTLRRSMIQNKTFTPVVGFPSPILKGMEGLPKLHGYVIATTKPRATTILEVSEAEEEEPILVTWRYGLGKTAAFTSDLGRNWAGDWVRWDHYKAFVHQLITDVLRLRKQKNLRMHSFAAGGHGLVVVEDYAPETTFLNLVATVEGPRDTEIDLVLEQVGPRRYEGKFPLAGEGRYHITALGRGEGRREERIFGGLMVPYSQEFLRLRANPIVLEQIAEQTGGRMLDGTESSADIFVPERQVTKRSLPVFDWFLLALACLVPLDVAVRRVQIDTQLIRDWLALSRTRKPSEEVFSQLLRRKRTVDATLYQHDEQLATTRRRQAQIPESDEQPETPAEPKAEPTSATEEQSTTERLLAMRRRIRDQEKEP